MLILSLLHKNYTEQDENETKFITATNNQDKNDWWSEAPLMMVLTPMKEERQNASFLRRILQQFS